MVDQTRRAMRPPLHLAAAAACAALLSCAPGTAPQATDPQTTNLGASITQPQLGGVVSAGPGAPTSARLAAPARARQRGGTGGLPAGDTIPGWSSPPGGPAAAPGSPGLIAGPALGENARDGAVNWGAPHFLPAPNSASALSGDPARVGGSPPSDTTRSPGSSGISGAGIANSLVGGPIR